MEIEMYNIYPGKRYFLPKLDANKNSVLLLILDNHRKGSISIGVVCTVMDKDVQGQPMKKKGKGKKNDKGDPNGPKRVFVCPHCQVCLYVLFFLLSLFLSYVVFLSIALLQRVINITDTSESLSVPIVRYVFISLFYKG